MPPSTASVAATTLERWARFALPILRIGALPGVHLRDASPRHSSRIWPGLLLALAAPLAATAAPDELLELPFADLLQVRISAAGKREERIRDIPASVTIVTREEIERDGWLTLEELLRHVPGFFILDNTEERFIGNRGAVGGGVQFLVNGIAQHPSSQRSLTIPEIARLNVPIESIDRIEIIRGPMSVIHGNDAFLGVVNLITNDIAAHGSRVSASLGTRGTRRLFGRVGQASADGAVVLNAGGWSDDGLNSAYADMMSPAQFAMLDPAMHREMDGDLEQREGSLELSAGWRAFSADVRWTRRDYGVYSLTPAFDDGTRIALDTLHAALGFAHRFSDDLGLRITGIHSREHYGIDRFDFLFDDLDGRQSQDSRRWELECDLHWQPNTALTTLFGYRLLRIDGIRNRADALPLIDVLDREEPFVTQDLFAEAGWQLIEPVRLTAGSRVSLLPAAYRNTRRDVQTGAVSLAEAELDDTRPVSHRLSLLWNPGPRQVVKLIWGNATQDVDDRSLADPQRIATLELNTTLTDPRWSVSASLFRNDIRNILRTIQVLDPATGNYAPIDDNSGRWRTHGLELILDLAPRPDLNLSASLTWQRTEDRQSDIDPGYSPALLATLQADWRHGPLTYAVSASYVDAMDADWNFVRGPVAGVVERIGERVPGDWNLGVNLRFDPRGTARVTMAGRPYFALHVSNLLDTDNRYPANELTAFEHGLIGPGRTVTATLGYVF